MLTLHPHGDEPMYQQITDNLRQEIVAGTLAAGTRLPSSRQLARDLRVSRITVATAYAELEAEGAVEAKPGSGTYVLPHWDVPTPTGVDAEAVTSEGDGSMPGWQRGLVYPANLEREAMLSNVLYGPLVPDMVGFSWGAGDPRLLPFAEFRRALVGVIDRDGPVALGPEGGAGYLPLRVWLTSYLRKHGLKVIPDDILITGGTQQTISLIAGTLLRPGDSVITEVPTWPGALEAFEMAGARVIGIPLDREGMRLDSLVAAIEQEQPRLIYTVPTFHNPTGVVMSARRRRSLCAVAERYGIPVLEDDHVREVRFGNPLPPPLATFDRHGNVIHAGSFTKSLIPSLRIGYVVVRGPLREAMIYRKRASDLFGSALMQRTLAAFLESGAVARHWRRISRISRRRHNVMLRSMTTHFPAEARWSGVAGGQVLWVRAPDAVSVSALHAAAFDHGVGFARGSAFFPKPADQPYLRVNFAAVDEAHIVHGITVLGRLLHQLGSGSQSQASTAMR